MFISVGSLLYFSNSFRWFEHQLVEAAENTEVGSFLFMNFLRVSFSLALNRPLGWARWGEWDVEMIWRNDVQLSAFGERVHTDHPTCPVGWADWCQITEKYRHGRLSVRAPRAYPLGSPVARAPPLFRCLRLPPFSLYMGAKSVVARMAATLIN